MKFKLKASDLNAALEVVSIVTPSPRAGEGAGYLFVINNGEKASVYSSDAKNVVRTSLPISDVEGEGAFVYPLNYTDAFKFLGDQVISFETTSNDDTNFYSVKYETESGASAEHTSFDPKLMMTHTDKDLADAASECEFPAGVLREALAMGRLFAAKEGKSNDKPQLKTLQIFDAAANEDWKKGDGYLFAADGVRALFFYSEIFQGKKLSIHSDHLAHLTSFLSRCEGDVTFKASTSFNYAVDEKTGNVLGWSQEVKQHGKFSYYSLKLDNYVLRVGRAALLNALKHTRSELDKKKDKIKFIYSAQPMPRIQFMASDSTSKSNSFFVPVTVVDNGEKSIAENTDFAYSFNIDHLIELVSEARGNNLEIRLMAVPAKEGEKPRAGLRTIDTFSLTKEGKLASPTDKDVIACTVTRFMPNKD